MEKVFPIILITLDFCAAGVYCWHGDVRHAVYWLAGCRGVNDMRNVLKDSKTFTGPCKGVSAEGRARRDKKVIKNRKKRLSWSKGLKKPNPGQKTGNPLEIRGI